MFLMAGSAAEGLPQILQMNADILLIRDDPRYLREDLPGMDSRRFCR